MTGFHRTALQLNNRNKLQKSSLALGITKAIQTLECGILFHSSDFNFPLLAFDNRKTLRGLTGYHSYQTAAFSMSGEIAMAGNQTFGLAQSIQYRTDTFRF